MNIDIRAPLGWLFTLLGLLLMAYGAYGWLADVQALRGVRVNLYWGAIMLVFGIAMLVLARAHRLRIARTLSARQ